MCVLVQHRCTRGNAKNSRGLTVVGAGEEEPPASETRRPRTPHFFPDTAGRSPRRRLRPRQR